MNRPATREINHLGQMFCVSLTSTSLTAEERRMLTLVRPGCVILFARNCQNPAEVRGLTDELRGLLGQDVLIAIDQEGGRVDRLRAFLPPMPAAEEVVAGGRQAATKHGSLTARALRLLGVNFNFAPVLDYLPADSRGVRNGLETRTFGPTPAEISENASAYLRSLQNGGVIGCLKHFPGLGGALLDPHEDFPVVRFSAGEIAANDLLPFRGMLQSKLAQAVMVGHAAYPHLEADNSSLTPASLSPRIVGGLLREGMDFDGVAVTDDLTMGAAIKAAGSLPEAARRAVNASQDLLLLCDSPDKIEEVHTALAQATARGEINQARPGESDARLRRLRSRLSEPVRFAEFRAGLHCSV